MARDLSAAAFEHMGGPFVWRKEDCCTGACNAFRAVHGLDPMASIRGAYNGKRGALQLIKQAGGLDDLAAQLADAAGLRAGIGAAGELGVSGQPDGRRGLVFSIGDGIWVGKSDDGFCSVPTPERSWRV